MIKVAMIGAGSVVFSRNLTGDILSYPEFKNATFAYMDIDKERLDVGAALCRKVAKSLDADPKIIATMDRREALRGADFIINMVQIGGFDSTLVDFEIPRKYGLNFTIADTTGPGGLFRALRTYPIIKGMCQDIEELCPNATLLNYSNPMSENMQTITRTSGVKAVGLCHSVQGTFNQLMRYIGEKPEEVAFLCAGINHMAFYLKMEKNGVDLYPRLFAAMDDPKIRGTNKVRFELMKRLGYFVTESSEHSSEYCPYFIPHGEEMIARFAVPIDEYIRRCEGSVEEFDRLVTFSKSDLPMKHHRSHEYGSSIIHSIVTGTPRVVYGNMPNRGAISNIVPTAIAEVPTLVDRAGLQFTHVGELPPQLVGYIQPHITQHELFIRAAMEGRRDHVYQACMFDPLTAASLTLDQIVEMCDELIAAHGELLPPLDAKKTLVPNSGKAFAKVDGAEFRRQREKAIDEVTQHYVKECHVVGPFLGDTPGKITLDFRTSVDDDFARRADGSIDLKATHMAGKETVKWKKAQSGERGYFDFVKLLGPTEWCVGYAYIEIEEMHGRETILRCGSNDGVRIWVNGKQVHQLETGRTYRPESDEVPIYLKAGLNRILVKVDNYTHGWGFGLRVPKATF